MLRCCRADVHGSQWRDMLGLEIGIIASLCTATSWAIANVIHSALSRMLGVSAFLMLRQSLATAVLSVLCLVAGQFQTYTLWAVGLGMFSGFVGLVVCDWCLYEGVLRIGIRPALVCHSLSSCFTALLGVLFLGEYLGIQGVLGILVATGGVILVIIAEQRDGRTIDPGQRRTGILLALVSAVAMACGMIFSKEAMTQGLPPLLLSLVRNGMATVVLWSLNLCLHRVRSSFGQVREHPTAVKLLLVGCVFGPVGGLWLSSVALNYAPAAVASTLIGLQPVALLIVSGIWERRVPSSGSIIGSITACCGAALLLLRS